MRQNMFAAWHLYATISSSGTGCPSQHSSPFDIYAHGHGSRYAGQDLRLNPPILPQAGLKGQRNQIQSSLESPWILAPVATTLRRSPSIGVRSVAGSPPRTNPRLLVATMALLGFSSDCVRRVMVDGRFGKLHETRSSCYHPSAELKVVFFLHCEAYDHDLPTIYAATNSDVSQFSCLGHLCWLSQCFQLKVCTCMNSRAPLRYRYDHLVHQPDKTRDAWTCNSDPVASPTQPVHAWKALAAA